MSRATVGSTRNDTAKREFSEESLATHLDLPSQNDLLAAETISSSPLQTSPWGAWHSTGRNVIYGLLGLSREPATNPIGLDQLTDPRQEENPFAGIASAATVAPPGWFLDRMLDLYAIRGHRQVTTFLEDNPFLLPLLWEAHSQILYYFGPLTQVVLEVIDDPEEGFQQLVAWIQTDLEPEDALARLDALDWGWWLDASGDSLGKMSLDLEYV